MRLHRRSRSEQLLDRIVEAPWWQRATALAVPAAAALGAAAVCRPASRQAGDGRSPRRELEKSATGVVARTRPSAPRVRGFASWTRSGFLSAAARSGRRRHRLLPGERGSAAMGLRRTRAGGGRSISRRGFRCSRRGPECALDGYAAVMGWGSDRPHRGARRRVGRWRLASTRLPSVSTESVDGPAQLRGPRSAVHVVRRVPDAVRARPRRPRAKRRSAPTHG